MKWLLALLLSVLSATAQQNTYFSAQKNATAYFYQSSGMNGSVFGTDIQVDGRKVCRLRLGRFCTIELAPGKHTVMSAGTWHSYAFDFQSGKTYYFRLDLRAVRAIGYLVNLVPVAGDIAETELRSCTKEH